MEIQTKCIVHKVCPYFREECHACVGITPGCALVKKYISKIRKKKHPINISVSSPEREIPESEIVSLPENEILFGDCIEVMKTFPENSIDCIVTDPPYGLKFMGKKWDEALPSIEAFEQMFRVLKPGALAFVMSSPRQDLMWRMLALLEGVGFELNQSYIDWIYKTGFPKAYDVSKGIDKKLGLDREIIGKNPNYRDPDTDHHERWNNAVLDKNITNPASELSEKWDGWKSQTGLKPAHEPILMVNKPRSEKTIVENVLRWGTGAINVDVCRIPFKNDSWSYPNGPKGSEAHHMERGEKRGLYDTPINANQKGRFPANLLVSDGAIDDKFDNGTKPHPVISNVDKYEGWGSGISKRQGEVFNYGDSGYASRYFDLDVWALGKGFCDTSKPSKKERGEGNIHPTVKPIKLMAYLIELGCPLDGIVLDPFVGSGTTCMAAKQLGKKWIGIELNKEYYEIAKRRVESLEP